MWEVQVPFFKNLFLTEDEYNKVVVVCPGLPGHKLASGRVKVPIAYILESLGLKGVRRDMVGLSPHHALVVETYGNVSHDDIDMFAKEIEEHVFNKTGLEIEREVVLFPFK